MQIFFGLNVTGSLDPDTLEVMRSPRCGVPDVEDYSYGQGARWDKNVITYRLSASALQLSLCLLPSLKRSRNLFVRSCFTSLSDRD